MEINSSSDILNILTAFLSLFFAFFLLTLKSKNRFSNVLIALYLIINAIDSSTIITSQFIFPKFPGLGLFLNTTLFFGPPILYLFVRSVCFHNIKIQKAHFLHVIPFVLAIVLLIPRFYLENYDNKISILSAKDEVIIEIKLVYLLLHLQTIAYTVASFLVVIRSKRLLLENYSGGSLNHYNWLISLLTLVSLEIVVSTFKNVFLLNNLDNQYRLSLTITGTVGLLFICWLVIQALRSPELYGKVNSKQLLVKQLITDQSNIQLAKNDLSSENENKIGLILDYMESNKPYLEPSLSIYDLSKRLDLPSKDLSILINHHLNRHFFDFVNEYRIKNAMKLLSDKDNNEKTVLEILYEVGFNSKSSFNTAFKKHTNLTPTQYRKKHIK